MVGPQPCPNLQAYRRQNTTAGSTTAFSRLSLQRLDFCLGFKCVSPGPGSRSPLSAFLVVTPWSPLLFGSVLLPIKTCTLPFGHGSPEGLPDHRLRTVPPISVRSRTLDHNPLSGSVDTSQSAAHRLMLMTLTQNAEDTSMGQTLGGVFLTISGMPAFSRIMCGSTHVQVYLCSFSLASC